MAERNEYVNVFHDVNAVTSIYHRGGFLLKVFKVFYSINLTLSRKGKFSYKK